MSWSLSLAGPGGGRGFVCSLGSLDWGPIRGRSRVWLFGDMGVAGFDSSCWHVIPLALVSEGEPGPKSTVAHVNAHTPTSLETVDEDKRWCEKPEEDFNFCSWSFCTVKTPILSQTDKEHIVKAKAGKCRTSSTNHIRNYGRSVWLRPLKFRTLKVPVLSFGTYFWRLWHGSLWILGNKFSPYFSI